MEIYFDSDTSNDDFGNLQGVDSNARQVKILDGSGLKTCLVVSSFGGSFWPADLIPHPIGPEEVEIIDGHPKGKWDDYA